MTSAPPILPHAAAWKDAQGRPLPVEFFRFLGDLQRYVRESTGDSIGLAELAARVAALEEGEQATIRGIGSILVQNGAVQLIGDVDNPSGHQVYGSSADGMRGWWDIVDALSVSSDLTKTISDDGYTLLGELDSVADLPGSASVDDAYLIDGDYWVWDGSEWSNEGPPSNSAELGLSDSGVTPGSYTIANITVDAKGRVTEAEDGTLDADQVPYDNTASGLAATDVQAAIDEIAAGGGGGGGGAGVKLLKDYGAVTVPASDTVFVNTSNATRRAIGPKPRAGAASGKRFFACRVNSIGTAGALSVGLIQQECTDGQIGQTGSPTSTRTSSWGIVSSGGVWTRYHGSTSAYGSIAAANGNVVVVYVDFATNRVWWQINNVIPISGNPATGANPAYSNLAGLIFPAASCAFTSPNNGELEFDFESASPFGATIAAGYTPWNV